MLLQVEVYAADGVDTLRTFLEIHMIVLGNHPQHQQQVVRPKKVFTFDINTRNGTFRNIFLQFSSRASEQMFYGTARDCEVTVRFSERTMHTAGTSPQCSVEEEKSLDERLERLRRRIAKSRAVTMRSKSEMKGLSKEIEMHGELRERELGEREVALRETRERVGSAPRRSRSVVETAKRLQPLLHQAERIAETGAFLSSNDAMASNDERRRDAVDAAQEAMRSCFVKGGSLENA